MPLTWTCGFQVNASNVEEPRIKKRMLNFRTGQNRKHAVSPLRVLLSLGQAKGVPTTSVLSQNLQGLVKPQLTFRQNAHVAQLPRITVLRMGASKQKARVPIKCAWKTTFADTHPQLRVNPMRTDGDGCTYTTTSTLHPDGPTLFHLRHSAPPNADPVAHVAWMHRRHSAKPQDMPSVLY